MTAVRTVVVVGAGVAGLRAAEATLKHTAHVKVVLVGNEPHPPYSRPALSKYMPADPAAFEVPLPLRFGDQHGDDGRLSWRLDTQVEGARLRSRALRLRTSGAFETIHYDRLVIASGVRPRSTSGPHVQCCPYPHLTLRSLDDAREVRRQLSEGREVTIIGAGYISCELASLATALGCQVSVVASGRHGPFEKVLGKSFATSLRRWIVDHGVAFYAGDAGSHLKCPHHGHARMDGPAIYAEAIGSVPNVEWLAGNGLDLHEGVRVDKYMRVDGWDDTFAVGDIAHYPQPLTGNHFFRVESWKSANDTGKVAGAAVAASLGFKVPDLSIRHFPTMTTDFLGLHLKVCGYPSSADAHSIIDGDLDQLDQGVMVQYLKLGKPVGLAYADSGFRLSTRYAQLAKTLTKTAELFLAQPLP
ncbi:NAD(P)/FAD-dependent oxidoreductase [Janibacter melonis]|uniref:FAD-dependent oxidoreductase n=1 Tax=Janibacter melonis TaxID=262209 RepID=UPI002044B454|nr:NAD(P)/FAD-dependent oxidoreductase [Janibacter melonis]MCM3556830.1 NAD(P)/FAD-dependent oxidoreductase [Janibacter melonis]